MPLVEVHSMLLLAIVLLLLPGEALASQQRPNVTRCSHCDNVPFKNDANVVKLFGLCVSARACEARCLNYNNSIPGSKAWDDGWEGRSHPGMIPSPLSGWGRCNSYTWTAEDHRCYGRVDDIWKPTTCKDSHRLSSSGRIDWPPSTCSADADCSYNGHCGQNHLCKCSAAWRGGKCQLLNLRPASSQASGVQWQSDDGRNISTWGGSVVATCSMV